MTKDTLKKENAALNSKPKKKKKNVSLEKQRAKMGWLFVSPFLIGFVFFYLPMIVDSIKYSFGKLVTNVGGGFTLEWVGFENYSNALFKDSHFTEYLRNSLGTLIMNVPAIVIFSLFMAVILNQKMRGRAIFRAIFFIPVIVSTGIIESIDKGSEALNTNMQAMSSGTNDLGENTGQQIISALDLSRFLSGFAIGQNVINRVLGIVADVYGIVSKSGVQMLIFLSGLQSISPAIYESCYIDGASSWETFWKITFPMISPMILVNSVYTIIDSFTSKSNQLMEYISEVYQGPNGNVKATAMAWMYFLIVIAIIALVAGVIRTWVFYQRREH